MMLSSIGRLCQAYQRSPHDLQAALAKAGVLPHTVLDNVPFYDEDEIERVDAVLRVAKPRGAEAAQ